MLKLYPIDQKVVQYSRKKVWKDLLVAGALLFYTFCAMVLQWWYRNDRHAVVRGMDAVVRNMNAVVAWMRWWHDCGTHSVQWSWSGGTEYS